MLIIFNTLEFLTNWNFYRNSFLTNWNFYRNSFLTNWNFYRNFRIGLSKLPHAKWHTEKSFRSWRLRKCGTSNVSFSLHVWAHFRSANEPATILLAAGENFVSICPNPWHATVKAIIWWRDRKYHPNSRKFLVFTFPAWQFFAIVKRRYNVRLNRFLLENRWTFKK